MTNNKIVIPLHEIKTAKEYDIDVDKNGFAALKEKRMPVAEYIEKKEEMLFHQEEVFKALAFLKDFCEQLKIASHSLYENLLSIDSALYDMGKNPPADAVDEAEELKTLFEQVEEKINLIEKLYKEHDPEKIYEVEKQEEEE